VLLEKSCLIENLSYLLSIIFQKNGDLFFKVSLEEESYQNFIIYGQTVLKKNLDLEIEEWTTPLMTTILLHFRQIREEDSKENSDKHSEMRNLHQPQAIIKEGMFQIFGASDVTNMGIMQEIVQLGRKEDNMLPPLSLVQNHPKRMKIIEMRSISSKTNIKLSMTTDPGKLFDH
jgi:hypothetical protein